MYMRSSMNQPTLNVVALRPGDLSTTKKVKKIISNMASVDPDERPKAGDVDRLLKAVVILVGIYSTMSRNCLFSVTTSLLKQYLRSY